MTITYFLDAGEVKASPEEGTFLFETDLNDDFLDSAAEEDALDRCYGVAFSQCFSETGNALQCSINIDIDDAVLEWRDVHCVDWNASPPFLSGDECISRLPRRSIS